MGKFGVIYYNCDADGDKCRFVLTEIRRPLPLKRQTKIAADDSLKCYFYLSKKIRLDFSCESAAYGGFT